MPCSRRARRILSMIAIGSGALLLVLLEMIVLEWHVTANADRSAVSTLHRFALGHPTWTATMRLVSWVGQPLTWWILLVPTSAYLLFRAQHRLAAWAVGCVAGGALLNALAKLTVARARPDVARPVASATGYSCPSGHAQAATVAMIVLVALLIAHRPHLPTTVLAPVAAAVAALVCFSRVALGVHYPSDVLAGALLGVSWVCALSAVMTRDVTGPADSGDPSPDPPSSPTA